MTLSNLGRNEDNLSGNILWDGVKIGSAENTSYQGDLLYGEGTNRLNI